MYHLLCHHKPGDPADLYITIKVSGVRVQVDSKPSTKVLSALEGRRFVRLNCTPHHSAKRTSRVRSLRRVATAPRPYLYFTTVGLHNSPPFLHVIHYSFRDQW
jgi:hypothetical protein